MVIALVWVMFLTLSYAVLDALQSSTQTENVVRTVYLKERNLLFLNSVLWKAAQYLDRDNNNYDSLTEVWAKPIETDTPLGKIKITIVDLDRYLNVNYVGRNLKITRSFERLLELLDISPSLEERLKVWNGAKKPSEGWDLPYPPKGKPLDSLYEFNYFWNNTKDLYGDKNSTIQKPCLLELTTVYSDGKINVNTAPYWVLRSLDGEIDDVLARQIIQTRNERAFTTLMDLLRVDGINMDLLYRINDLIKFKSRYFKITATLREGERITTVEGIYDKTLKRFVLKKVY